LRTADAVQPADDNLGDVSLSAPFWSGCRVAQLTSDDTLLAALLEAEVALAGAMADHGGVARAAADVIARAADPTAFGLRSIAIRARGGGNPLIPLLDDLRARVRTLDPSAVEAVHRGATSQDMLDSAWLLVAARALPVIRADLRTAADGVASLAERYRGALMASRTLTQQGVPTTFGLKAAGWLSGLTEALSGLDALTDTLPAQLGGASGTLAATTLLLGPERALAVVESFAARLGLQAPRLPWHTQRAPMTRLADTLVSVSDALGKLALDVLVMARTEIAEVTEPAAAGRGGSSAMPQKQNPVLSILIAAAARKAPGLAAELHRSAQAVDERPDGAWHVEWGTLQELLRLVGGAAALAAELTPGLVVDEARLRANLALTGGLVLSERLLLELTPVLGRQRVQELIAEAGREGDLRTLLTDVLAGTDISTQTLLDPAGYLGCADIFIERALSDYRQAH
jgi:3-carboxy-cis,cis-muconate cycloisomerase